MTTRIRSSYCFQVLNKVLPNTPQSSLTQRVIAAHKRCMLFGSVCGGGVGTLAGGMGGMALYGEVFQDFTLPGLLLCPSLFKGFVQVGAGLGAGLGAGIGAGASLGLSLIPHLFMARVVFEHIARDFPGIKPVNYDQRMRKIDIALVGRPLTKEDSI